MTEEKAYYVYIMASRSRTLYIGFTSRPEQRIAQHKAHIFPGFSSKYRCERLVHLERYMLPSTAIAREKALKGWLRSRKIALIEQSNPSWVDLSKGWGKSIFIASCPAAAIRGGSELKQTAGPSLRSG